jgi:hypothetical protein
MKILWLSPLVQQANRPNAWQPLMHEVAQANGNFPNVWLTTTANAALRPLRFAEGLAEVTTPQLNAINATPGIVTVSGEFLFGDAPPAVAVFGTLPAVLQTKINERLVTLLGIAPAQPIDTIRDVFNRAIDAVAPETLNTLVNMLAQQWGI